MLKSIGTIHMVYGTKYIVEFGKLRQVEWCYNRKTFTTPERQWTIYNRLSLGFTICWRSSVIYGPVYEKSCIAKLQGLSIL